MQWSAVTSISASVEVTLQDAKSQRLVAKGRYTEQAPHTIKSRASAYLTTAASAAKSTLQRLQTAAEHVLHTDGQNANSGSVPHQTGDGNSSASSAGGDGTWVLAPDLRQKAVASFGQAGVTVRATANRLQRAADSALRSSSAAAQQDTGADADSRQHSTEQPEVTVRTCIMLEVCIWWLFACCTCIEPIWHVYLKVYAYTTDCLRLPRQSLLLVYYPSFVTARIAQFGSEIRKVSIGVSSVFDCQ